MSLTREKVAEIVWQLLKDRERGHSWERILENIQQIHRPEIDKIDIAVSYGMSLAFSKFAEQGYYNEIFEVMGVQNNEKQNKSKRRQDA